MGQCSVSKFVSCCCKIFLVLSSDPESAAKAQEADGAVLHFSDTRDQFTMTLFQLNVKMERDLALVPYANSL